MIAPGSDKLRRVDLVAKEDGKPVTVTQSGGGSAAAIGLAIDVSRSMQGAPLAAAKSAAASFVKSKRKADSIGVYSFGHQANPVHALDTDPNALASSMQQVTLDTVQGTALYDSVIQASSELATAPTLTKVLVVLTDGDDTSKTKLAAAVSAAKNAGVTVDAIAIGTRRPRGAQRRSRARPAATSSQPTTRLRASARSTGRSPRRSATPTASSTPRTPTASTPLQVSLKGYVPATAVDRPHRSRGRDRRRRRHRLVDQQAQLGRASPSPWSSACSCWPWCC